MKPTYIKTMVSFFIFNTDVSIVFYDPSLTPRNWMEYGTIDSFNQGDVWLWDHLSQFGRTEQNIWK